MKDTEKEDYGKDGKRRSGDDLPDRVSSQIHAGPADYRNQNQKRERLPSVNDAQCSQRRGDAECMRADLPVASDVLH